MFQKIPQELFFSKNDLDDVRLGDWSDHGTIETVIQDSSDLVVLGYCDDEGIQLNGGRTGASLAPNVIRKYFYRMTPHLHHSGIVQIRDLGNSNKEFDLAKRHENGAKIIEHLTLNKKLFVSLGGGHDYAYADGAGFIRGSKSEKKPLILNFDAHLDVRPSDKNFNSGTAFYRLMKEFGNQFEFAEIGIQSHCNSQKHMKWAEDHGATIAPLETIERQGLISVLSEITDFDRTRPCFISIDIDGFSNTQAPGCSQAWATGLKVQEVFEAIEFINSHFDVRGCGIYEVSPPLDIDDRTSKLAAQTMHKFFFSKILQEN